MGPKPKIVNSLPRTGSFHGILQCSQRIKPIAYANLESLRMRENKHEIHVHVKCKYSSLSDEDVVPGSRNLGYICPGSGVTSHKC